MSNVQPPHRSDSLAPRPGVAAAQQDGGRRVASSDLLGPDGALIIVHAGREYRLRVTQNGKLILTA